MGELLSNRPVASPSDASRTGESMAGDFDINDRHFYFGAFDVAGGKRLTKGRVFAEIDPGPANVRFGGPKRNRLFITASTAIYGAFLAQTRAQRP